MEPDKQRALGLFLTFRRCQNRSVVWLRWRHLATRAVNAEKWFGRAPRSCKRIPINGSAPSQDQAMGISVENSSGQGPRGHHLCDEPSASSIPDPAPRALAGMEIQRCSTMFWRWDWASLRGVGTMPGFAEKRVLAALSRPPAARCIHRDKWDDPAIV